MVVLIGPFNKDSNFFKSWQLLKQRTKNWGQFKACGLFSSGKKSKHIGVYDSGSIC
jgi:hypothetical protein